MSYCVNCGVELDASAKACPLCNTRVINPQEYKKLPGNTPLPPFPEEKGTVETVKSKDFAILLSMVVLATSVTCGLLNAFVFPGTLWSLAVIGVCAIVWVMMIPVVIYKKQSIYLSLLLDAAAVAVYLYMLAYMVGNTGWFWGLGIPIVALLWVVAEAFTFCVRRCPKSFLTVALELFTAVAIVCVGLEILIDYYLRGQVRLMWSAVVLTVCAIMDIAIITMLSRRRLRNAVRRRLHF